MHQTVYNTHKAFVTGDMSRILEMTDPLDSGLQVKRMAIHNDVLLMLCALLYFIHAGPETLLVLQSFTAASGAIALYLIANKLFSIHQVGKDTARVSFVIALGYLLYAPLQRTLLYEFHAVVLATPCILWMYLAYLKKRYFVAAIFGVLVLLAKEHTGFSLGVFLLLEAWRRPLIKMIQKRNIILVFSALKKMRVRLLSILGACSFVYVAWSVFLLIPAYRLGDHFALSYFLPHQGSGVVSAFLRRLVDIDSWRYISQLLAPLLFLPLGSTLVFPAIPDIAINVLSSRGAMRNIYFHYTAIITPWLFISIAHVLARLRTSFIFGVSVFLMFSSTLGSITLGPLPEYATLGLKIIHENSKQRESIRHWQKVLAQDTILVSSTGQFAPYLTSRRYFYNFGQHYVKADYVVLRRKEIFEYPEKEILIPHYKHLIENTNFRKIFDQHGVEVYKRI
jgi:uncharacterized membrane protein